MSHEAVDNVLNAFSQPHNLEVEDIPCSLIFKAELCIECVVAFLESSPPLSLPLNKRLRLGYDLVQFLHLL